MSVSHARITGHERDSADLASFGYRQELKRTLGVFSSFSVAFSYISPSTGIFTLFALGLGTIGGVFIWTWPGVALGQFIVALNFAEVSSHYPVAGSVFQWTKYLSGRTYSWSTGWIYLFAGILTVTAVVATLPLALIPAINGLGWHGLNAGDLHTQEIIALITLAVIAVLNIYGVRLVALIGGVFLLGTLIAIPSMHQAITGAWGPAQIIDANFSSPFATLYLLVVSAAIFVCCLSILAATIRLCFGMSRDRQLPISRPLAQVAPSLHTPIWTCVAIAVLAAVPFIKYSGAGTIAIAATGMIYLSYFLGNLVVMRSRLRGWPKASAPFRLGRWGPLANIVALLYGGAMLVNFAWPRVASNPGPDQTGGLLSFGWSLLNKIPILWTVVVGITLIGAIHYLATGRRQPFTPIMPPPQKAPVAGTR
jgi:amino acid transporter